MDWKAISLRYLVTSIGREMEWLYPPNLLTRRFPSKKKIESFSSGITKVICQLSYFGLLTYLTGPHPSTSAVLVQDERSQEALKTSFPSLFASLSNCILALTNLCVNMRRATFGIFGRLCRRNKHMRDLASGKWKVERLGKLYIVTFRGYSFG